MRAALTMLLAIGLAGCTMVSVKKVDVYGKGKGVRYSLPKPFIVVTPKSDGTLDVRVEMLPDPTHTYAVHAKSFLAQHDLQLKISKGLLTEVEWTRDSSAVAAEAAKAAGAVAKAREDAEIALLKAEREKADEIADEERKAVAALEALLSTARVDEAVAEAEYEATPTTPKDKKDAAKLKWDAAKARRKALEKELGLVSVSRGLIAGRVLADDEPDEPDEAPSQKPLQPAKFKEVPGPLLLQIVETRTGDEHRLMLRPAAAQTDFGVYRVKGTKEKKKPSGADEPFKLDKTELGVITTQESFVETNKEFDTVEGFATNPRLGQPVVDGKPTITRESSKKVKIAFATDNPRQSGHATGSFNLELTFKKGDVVVGTPVVTYKVE